MIERMVEYILDFDQSKIETKYRDYLSQVKKMNGPGNIQLLSKVCSFLNEDEVYLEIGTHRGCTLLGASLGNEHRQFVGVDNFAGHNSTMECYPFQTIEEGLRDAIVRLAPSGNVSYIKEDYKKFLQSTRDVNGKKVGVYLYDGDHQLQNQYWGLRLCPKILSDNAIVFVDDSANNDREAVWGAINKVLQEDKRFSVIKEFIPAPGEMHGDFWCGFVAMKYEVKK